MEKIYLKNGQVLLDGKFEKKNIWIDENGKIQFNEIKNVDKEIDVENALIMPSLFDMHTHIRCPGQEYKEDFDHATKAAVHGGFTEICSMPNTNPVADNEAIIDYIILEANSYNRCKIYPFGALTAGLKGEKLSRMGLMKAKGAIGVTDDGHCIQNTAIMMRAMEYANTFGLFIMDHAEDTSLSEGGSLNEGFISDKLGLSGIPEIAETIAIKRDIEISRYLDIPIHITHVSTKNAAEIILRAKEDGVKITFDITPHHLSFTENNCSTFDTNYKVNPPLRSEEDRQYLINLVKEGKVDAIATDHAPHAIFEKEYTFDNAPFGISNLDTALSLLYKTLTIESGIPIEKWITLISNKPRQLLGLNKIKIEEDEYANLVIFNTDKEWKVTANTLYSKGKNTPLIGKTLKGVVEYTIYNGKIVYPFAL